ncbi:MAG: gamma-glutamyl-gamma-aminobutyrate hydrolase family protein, partial [Armatimonadota bacterium]|nr:gamma-glutamyl-gamma-aminobutyrate hydrolase family protein [Armatimonadota bacterium]
PETAEPSEETDRFEIEICRHCIEMNLPLLAICRGVQVLNVALGGTLVQDIPTQLSTPIQHRQKASRQTATHPIHLEPGTQLAAVLGETDVPVNSFHHQALARLGSNLKVSAWSEDNMIEGVELPDKDFVLGVQFHPEETTRTVRPTANLFTALVEAARKNRSGNETGSGDNNAAA